MADDFTVKDAGGSTITIGADLISSVYYGRHKMGWGPDGTFNEVDRATGKDLPVRQRDAKAVSTSFTCGTTAYAANDVVGTASSNAALTFAALRPDGAGEFMITSATLEIDTTALISGETSYLLELYNVTPPSAISDSGAWDIASGDRASHLGTIALGVPVDKGSTLKIDTDGILKQITMAGTDLFAYLVSVGAYTPTARVFVITLHGYPL